MKPFHRFGACLAVAVLAVAVGPACGGGGTDTNPTSSSSSSGGGETTTTTSTTGTGGTSSTTSSTTSTGTGGTGTGGTGGTGGAGPVGHGPPASQLVNGGDVVKSPGYKMVFTLGQPTQNQTKTTSPGYRMQGGLIGATGTSP